MEPWKRRLEIIKKGVEDNIEQCRTASEDVTLKTNLKAAATLLAVELDKYINKLTEDEVVSFTELQLNAEILISAASNGNSKSTIIPSRLPKLELPKFKGDILKFTEFWDRFRGSIDAQYLSNADKLSYLKASLENEALAAIEGLDMTDKNYEIAVNILKERYGRPGLVIDAHYEAIYKLRKATDSAKDCMNTFNDIERHLRVLQGLGEDVNQTTLRVQILSKFPEELIYELRKRTRLEDESTQNIRKLLEQQIEALITLPVKKAPLTTEVLFSAETTHQRSVHRSNRNGERSNKQEQNLLRGPRKIQRENFNTSTPKRSKLLPCIFCAGNHFNDECQISLQTKRQMMQNRCYICLKKDHMARNCKSNKSCFHCKGKKHNSALCPKRHTHKPEQKNNTFTYLGTTQKQEIHTLLQTAIVTIRNRNNILKCRALLDTGSQRSYITEDIVKQLETTSLEPNVLTVYTFGTNRPHDIESPATEIEILGNESVTKIKVNVMPYITEKVDYPNLFQIPTQYRSTIADDGSLGTRIDMLIGNDYYHTFMRPKWIRCGRHLCLIQTEFGWVWSGTSEGSCEENLSIITHVHGDPIQINETGPDHPLRYMGQVHKLWDLETLGILDCPKLGRDDQAVDEFNRTVKFHTGRYWIKWPWCRSSTELPSNLGLSYGRLRSLLNRLDEETLRKYDLVITDQMKREIIERVDSNSAGRTLHYLPHHGVHKGDTIRIVYDASSKVKGKLCLNECLYRGPLLLENLTGLIIRFRTHKYGILADIEKAFLQIGIQEEDRDVTRFLWIKDITRPVTEENLQHWRFCRVPFGIGCSPFLLAITLKHHLRSVNTPICEKVARDIYVDNLVSGGNSNEECFSIYRETKAAFEAISMNMCKWQTNNHHLSQATGGSQADVTVLGVNWSQQRDCLFLRPDSKTNMTGITKRQILGYISTVFDPCGFATPLMIAPKLFLQELWKRKFDWDTNIPIELQMEWQTIVQQMAWIKKIEVPRWFGIDEKLRSNGVKIELHCYTDASIHAYAAAVYVRVIQANLTKSSLVMAKSRLTPVKHKPTNTIPRLELLGVLVGCRLLKYVQNHLDIPVDRQYLWTDSQIVLQWLNSKRVLPPFVTARVEEITKLKHTEFRYVPTDLNPADKATRPWMSDRPLNLTSWFTGPPYLNQDSDWPALLMAENTEHVMLTSRTDNDIEILRKIQSEHFSQELLGKTTNLSRSLGLFKDENGLLRCKGRFKNVLWNVDQKYPILIPRNEAYTTKLVENIHKKLYHVGVSQTLSNIRRRYWIPQGRAEVQKVLKRCLICRKHGGGPYKLPPLAQLPEERVNLTAPFKYTGTDILGPLYIQTSEGQNEKRWVCIFTCLVVRAVHLEIVTSLSAEECLLAIRRFAASRGLPNLILSDNATNYKLTAEVMTGDFCIQNKIEWKFITELAPWHGGVYERLVGLVKHCLRRTIDKHILNDSPLTTIIKEVEAVLNCRPLTTVGEEIEHVLTPADFLAAGGLLTQEESDIEFTEPSTDIKINLIDGWKRGQVILKEFKKMFINQYLPSLRERHLKINQPRVVAKEKPKVGHIVQIREDCPRVKWKEGEICELMTCKEGEVRTAKIKVGDKIYTRSVGHLYPLEIEENETERETETVNISEKDRVKESEQKTSNQPRNSKRKAAETAKKKMKEWTRLLFTR